MTGVSLQCTAALLQVMQLFIADTSEQRERNGQKPGSCSSRQPTTGRFAVCAGGGAEGNSVSCSS